MDWLVKRLNRLVQVLVLCGTANACEISNWNNRIYCNIQMTSITTLRFPFLPLVCLIWSLWWCVSMVISVFAITTQNVCLACWSFSLYIMLILVMRLMVCLELHNIYNFKCHGCIYYVIFHVQLNSASVFCCRCFSLTLFHRLIICNSWTIIDRGERMSTTGMHWIFHTTLSFLLRAHPHLWMSEHT